MVAVTNLERGELGNQSHNLGNLNWVAYLSDKTGQVIRHSVLTTYHEVYVSESGALKLSLPRSGTPTTSKSPLKKPESTP
jgi:hypothetical protein